MTCRQPVREEWSGDERSSASERLGERVSGAAEAGQGRKTMNWAKERRSKVQRHREGILGEREERPACRRSSSKTNLYYIKISRAITSPHFPFCRSFFFFFLDGAPQRLFSSLTKELNGEQKPRGETRQRGGRL